MIARKKELQKLKDFDAYEFVSADGQQRMCNRWLLSKKNDSIKARLVTRFEETSEIQADSLIAMFFNFFFISGIFEPIVKLKHT